jgi:VWFA-related protein
VPRLLSHYALLFACGLLAVRPAMADLSVVFHGKVTLEDGSPPGHMILVQRYCEGGQQPFSEGAASGKTGEYFVRLMVNQFGTVQGSTGAIDTYSMLSCYLEAADSHYVSSRIDLSDPNVLRNPRLPTIILTPKSRSTVPISADVNIPRAAARSWNLAIKQLTARNWAAAESPLRAVVQAAPKFATGWSALGTMYGNLGKAEDSRKALERAIELDPKPLPPYLALARAQIDVKDWKAAAATSQSLIARDTKHTYVEAYFLSGIALYQMHDFDGALARIDDAIRFDKLHELPRTQYVLGLIFEAKSDYAAAGEHLRAYVEQHPKAKDLAQVNDRIANLGKAPLADLSTELTPLDLRVAATGEAPVPGGIKAFSRVAQLKGTPSPEDFFLQYCHAIADGGPTGVSPTKEAGEEVKVFISTVAALESLGEKQDGGTLVRIALTSDDDVRKSRAILAELGLKLVAKGDWYALEPGERPHDGARQWALAGLGVDEFELREAFRQKRAFTFEIPRENARLVGGPAWGLALKGVPDMAGGPAEAFIEDWRFARVYSALGAMGSDSAAAVVSALTLENLIVKYSTLMADYGDAISLEDKHVAVPGGVKAQPVWARLTGANPQTPAPFLRALFEKDEGRLLAFYYDLARADTAHQQYFTQSSQRAEAFYKWYRASMLHGLVRTPSRWQAKILQSVPIDAAGRINFPGGRDAWAGKSQNDDDVLLQGPSLEALTAITALEEKRGAPLNSASARLLAQRYPQWRSLFPYFEKLPALDTDGFRALADFSDDAAKAPTARRNVLTGEWHSLVKLIVLGVQAGSLNATQSAQAFAQACAAMRTPNPSASALAVLRALTPGATDLDEAVVSQLLRLTGVRREAFESVRRLQNVPRLATLGDSPDPNSTIAALGGNVYAALLDPAELLVAEDPQLLSKHNYAPAGDLFANSRLAISSDPPGTNFMGGFASFQDAASVLLRQAVGDVLPPAEDPPAGAGDGPRTADTTGTVSEGDLVFHAGGRIVEVYATVTDSRGRYVDDLEPGQFSVLEQGQSKPVFAFENRTAGVSVALLFDTTGSMVEALPPLKAAAMQLVDDLRANDSVAVYSFSDAVTELQPFTSDKELAKRAILKTHAQGITALYDALVRVNRDLAARGGKKVIIVFTDGMDNASMLTANSAIERAKTRGIPIYTIAEGEALDHPRLMAELNKMSQATGGSQFLIHRLSDIATVFDKVSQDLMHGYLVAFQPAPGDNHSWRRIEVIVSGAKGLQVRAREGFYVE